MSNPLLSNFELAGQQIDIRDSASYDLATAAQQAATTFKIFTSADYDTSLSVYGGFSYLTI